MASIFKWLLANPGCCQANPLAGEEPVPFVTAIRSISSRYETLDESSVGKSAPVKLPHDPVQILCVLRNQAEHGRLPNLETATAQSALKVSILSLNHGPIFVKRLFVALQVFRSQFQQKMPRRICPHLIGC